MSSISSIDTSLYSGLIESISQTSGRNASAGFAQPTQGASRYSPAPVDLSNYYSNIEKADLLQHLAENVAQSAEDLDNAMVSALENGMGVNDACNINAAKAAYAANCSMLKSTFELEI